MKRANCDGSYCDQICNNVGLAGVVFNSDTATVEHCSAPKVAIHTAQLRLTLPPHLCVAENIVTLLPTL
jgi:hypothetical protein